MTAEWIELRRIVSGHSRTFREGLFHARALQKSLFLRIIELNRHTQFGEQHGFSRIRSIEDYRNTVPIHRYEDISPWFQKIAQGEQNVLFPGRPASFEMTGGSEGGSKLISHSLPHLNTVRCAIRAWLDDLFQTFPSITSGQMYWVMTPPGHFRRRLENRLGIFLSTDETYLGDELASALSALLVVPKFDDDEVSLESWFSKTSRALLKAKELSLISLWSPTLFLELLKWLRLNWDSVIEELGSNPAERGRADRLSRLGQNFSWSDVWPKLSVVSGWASASSKIAAMELMSVLPFASFQPKGLVASEAVVSIPLGGETWPVLVPSCAFVEFLDDGGAVVDLADLEVGRSYEILLTTLGGLYRYAIGDIVCVRGFLGEAPLLEFEGRSGVCSDLVGEKLTEPFVSNTLNRLELSATLLASLQPLPHYRLVLHSSESNNEDIEKVRYQVEESLCSNPQYALARALGQLDELQVEQNPIWESALYSSAVRDGRKLGDVKIPTLIPAEHHEKSKSKCV